MYHNTVWKTAINSYIIKSEEGAINKFFYYAIPAALLLYILSLKPAKARREAFRPFEETMIAHRGYFDAEKGIPENSLPAYRRAVENGYGIELDVQITTDGKLVCFHDETLERMCGEDVKLTDLSYDELMRYRLGGTDEKIPLFEEALGIFGNKVPVIIEIKAHGNYIRTAMALMEYLDDYKGDWLVESFHPRLVRWFRKNRPDILRGQLSTVFEKKKGVPFIARFVATNLMTNFYAKPDFIAYDFHHRNQFSYRLLRFLYHVENVAWTIRSKADLDEAKDIFKVFIFDSFDPEDRS